MNTARKKTRARSERRTRSVRKTRLPRHHAIAIREAGHAVAALERGVMLMPLSIFANTKGARRNVWDDPLRNVDFEWVKTAESPALARRLASILIAGPVAERVLGPRLPRATASVERLRDARALLTATSRGPAGGSRGLAGRPRGPARGSRGPSVDSRELFAEALADSERFLEEPRVKQAVAALAAVLLERGTIRGGEAASIIETYLDV